MGADPKDRLAIALDVDDLVVAVRLAKAVRAHVGVAKVGLELYSAVGPDAITAMIDLGFTVFADIKLHDIPTTVRRVGARCSAPSARATSTSTPPAARRCWPPASRACSPARPAPGLPRPVRAGGDGAHLRRRGAGRAPRRAGPPGGRRRAAAASCARSPTSRRSAAVGPDLALRHAGHPHAGGRARTTRAGSPRRPRPSPPAPTSLVLGRTVTAADDPAAARRRGPTPRSALCRSRADRAALRPRRANPPDQRRDPRVR